MIAEPRWHCTGGTAEKVGKLKREMRELIGVKRGDMGKKHGTVAEVLGDSWVSAYATDRRKAESGLLLEKIESCLELAVEEVELRQIAFGVALHL